MKVYRVFHKETKKHRLVQANSHARAEALLALLLEPIDRYQRHELQWKLVAEEVFFDDVDEVETTWRV